MSERAKDKFIDFLAGVLDDRNQDDVYYENCSEAREDGAELIREDEPGYREELDRDGDGVACEPWHGR
jgi:excalibur domain protein